MSNLHLVGLAFADCPTQPNCYGLFLDLRHFIAVVSLDILRRCPSEL